jgi:hypothetical protein
MNKVTEKKNNQLINQNHKKRYPNFFKNNINGIYLISYNIENIKLDKIYFPSNYYIFIILLNNINFTHKLSDNILIISHKMKSVGEKIIINFCKKYDRNNIIYIQNLNIKCIQNKEWLFKSDMGLYYPKILITPQILIDPSKMKINELLNYNGLLTSSNINIIKRFFVDKISKIIIQIKMENIPYNFKNLYPKVKEIITLIDYTPDMLKQAFRNKNLDFFLKKMYQKISQLKING